MASVDQLLAEFADEFRTTGEADPRKYLRQVEGPERRELVALIDGYLEHAPRRSWDSEAFRGSLAERVTEQLAGSLQPEAEPLTELLVELRNQRKLRRDELTERLADSLGVSGRERKVARYYHQLERGILPAEGVSGRVFEALGSILGASAERLRAAGTVVGGAASDAPASPAFARQASPGIPTEPASPSAADRVEEEWDEVDRLFRADG